MKKHFSIIFLILIVSIFIPALSGCKGGGAPSSSKTGSAASSSSAAVNAGAANRLSPGLWKMTLRSTILMPSVMGRPPMNHSAVTTMTECIKPGSQNAKPYAAKPTDYKCSAVKEHVDMDGTIHWAMKCNGPKGSMSSKGVSKIMADSFTSQGTTVTTVKTSTAPGFSMKATVYTTGKRISAKCPSKP